VLDSGLGYRQRRIAQTAADAGALGGAHEIMRERYDLVTGSATEEIVRNGFLATEVVTIVRPPATGNFAGNDQFVEVIIGRNVPTLLAQLFNQPSWNIMARAVAGVSTTSFNCLYTLNPSGITLAISPGAEVTANCGAALNGSLQVDNGADLTATGIAVTGSVIEGNSADISPAAVSGAVAPLNPLAGLDTTIANYVTAQVPPTGNCIPSATQLVVTSDMTIGPGTYCGGIRIATGGTTLTMTSGTYVLAGGGLELATSAVIQGTGVTIINTNGPNNNATEYQPFIFGSGTKCNLQAPTTGQFANLLLIQDPTAGVTGTTYTHQFGCANDFPMVGTIYLPTQIASFQGSNSDTQINGSLIAYGVNVGSGTTLTLNQPVNSISAVKRVSLVE
jgi:hypothetical protein